MKRRFKVTIEVDCPEDGHSLSHRACDVERATYSDYGSTIFAAVEGSGYSLSGIIGGVIEHFSENYETFSEFEANSIKESMQEGLKCIKAKEAAR